MIAFFLKIVNMSISAGWLVLVVLLLRMVLKQAPKWVRVLLWGLVAVRLICPFSFESVLSLIPSTETISPEIMLSPTPQIHTGISSLNSAINPIITESFAPAPLASMNPLQLWIPLAAIGWLVGIAAMLIYAAVSYILLRRKVATAVLLRDNIYQSEHVDSPFVLGLVKPRIYLPFQMDDGSLEYVIAHENSHIRRKDHWWKPLGFLLLAFYWIHPFMWLGYILLCRDIELACDEKVIREMDSESRADYTQALVACSVSHRGIAACPLAFGEVSVKARVKSVMNYRKPSFWIIVAAVLICIAVAVCFLTDPPAALGDIPTHPTPATATLPDIRSHAYAVEEVIYEGGPFSFSLIAGINTPIYFFAEDMPPLSESGYNRGGEWLIGQPEPFTLTKENFDDLFLPGGHWRGGLNAKAVRHNTTGAWQLLCGQDKLYYLLPQDNGELYMAVGHPGNGLRWLLKLTVFTVGPNTLVAKSGAQTVPMVAFPVGTATAAYADSVHWLTIAPDNMDFTPFSVWNGSEEVLGHYFAFDAETLENLNYVNPSGLSSHTYIFSLADPTHRYIVGTVKNGTVYAFGAQFASDAP